MHDDYAQAGRFRRVVRQLVTSAPVAWLAVRFLPGIDRRVYRLTKGRQTFSEWMTGLPVVMLITTGARTGQRRTTRLLGIPDGDGIVVIAANFGQASNPSWYHNVRAHPLVSVFADGAEVVYEAREVTGADRDRLFERAVAMNPGWVRFRNRAGARDIPVVRLRPITAT